MTSTAARRCGVAAIAGAVLAIAGNAWLFVVDPAVPHDKLSWPLTPHAYVGMQLFFALTQALLAAGVYGLTRSTIVSRSRTTRLLGLLATTGMVLTVPGELVLILVRDQDADAGSVSALSTVFGLGVLLADIGLIGLGLLALRQRHWPWGWSALPLVLGAFQLLVVTPVSLAAGFTSVASNLVIGIADVLTAAIGVALLSPSLQAPRTVAGTGVRNQAVLDG
jgi:hypothetical protein